MSVLHKREPDDQQLVDYLLGRLEEDEAEWLDEMSIAEAPVACRLQLVEDELVDAYVRGSLTGESLERFESFFLASPRRREKVKFASSFLDTIAKPAPSASGVVAADALPGTPPDKDRVASAPGVPSDERR